MDWQEKDISGWAKETLQEILAEALKDPESSGLVRTPWTFLEVHVLRVEVSGEASLCGRKGQVLLQFDLSLGAELEIKATRSYGADFPRSQHWPRWPAVLRVLGFESGEARPEVQVQFDDPQSEVASEVAWFLHEGLGAKLLQRALDRWRATARRRFAAQEPAASATETTETATSWMSADAMLTASMKRIPHPVRPKKKAVAREPLVKPVAKFVEASLEEAWPAEPSARAERLHQALRARRYAEVFGLLDSPACILNLPVSEEGLSALHSAVLSNSTDMLSLILQARAELAPKDLLGRTPLLMALKKGSLELSRSLLEAGAFEAEEGWLVDRLSQCLDLSSAPELFELIDAKERPRRQGRALLRALLQKDARTAEAALEAGADPSLSDGAGGDHPLHLLAKTKWREESVVQLEVQKLTRKLVQAKADVNARNARSETPLLFAAHRGDSKMVQSLLELRADPAAANDEGSTALMFAAHSGHEEVCRMLLEAYAAPGVRNCHGLTAEEMATKRGFRKIGALIAAHALAPVTPCNASSARKRPAGAAISICENVRASQEGLTDKVLAALRPQAFPDFGGGGGPKAQVRSFDHSKWDRIVEDLERREEVKDRKEGLAKHPEYVWKNGVKMRVML